MQLQETLTILAIFISAGATLKMADLWGEAGGGFKAYLASASAATLFWLMLKLSPSTSTLALAIILGSLFSGKIDRLNLVLGSILILILAVMLGFTPPVIPALILLTGLAALDEYLHEADGKILALRPALKIGVIVAAAIGWIVWEAALALLLFDLSYEALGRWRPA